jgi:glycosyltransferase involved in cell wall biosynthesis
LVPDARVRRGGRAVSASPPLVSIVVPTHNRAALLPATLRCLLAQDVAVEVIVVDDGSADATREVLSAWRDERLRTVRHEVGQGVSAARNAGLARAAAPWVAFCDDDDLWAPDKLSRQLAALAAQPGAGWSATAAVVVDERWRILGVRDVPAGDVTTRLLRGNAIPGGGSAVLARTALVCDLGGFDPDLSMLADWDLWTRLALASPFAGVAELGVVIVRHDLNMSLAVAGSVRELDVIGRKHAEARAARGVDAHDRKMRRWLAWSEARSGQRREALRMYLQLARRERSPRLAALGAFSLLGRHAVTARLEHKVRRLAPARRREADELVGRVRAIAGAAS